MGRSKYLAKNCSNLGVHQIPKPNEVKAKWISVLGLKTIKTTDKICGQHFCSDDYVKITSRSGQRQRLKAVAVPSIFQEQILEVDVGETAIVAAFEEVQVQRDDTNPVFFPEEDLGSMGRDLDPPTAAQPVVDQPLQGSRFYLRLEAVKEDDKMMAYYSDSKPATIFFISFPSCA